MTATTESENGVLHRKAISLPLFRPISKPPPGPALQPKAMAESPAPAAGSPPTVQPIQKLDLDLLGNGDKLVVRTANSTYNFEMRDRHSCKVIPGKSSARTGEAVLLGGTNADASEYTPDRILVGGRVAYQFPGEETAVLTSVVESIFLSVPCSPGPRCA